MTDKKVNKNIKKEIKAKRSMNKKSFLERVYLDNIKWNKIKKLGLSGRVISKTSKLSQRLFGLTTLCIAVSLIGLLISAFFMSTVRVSSEGGEVR